MNIILETDRLILRQFTANDASLIHELDSDPEVMRYITDCVPTPLEKIENETLPHWLNVNETHPDYGYWAAIKKNNAAFIGWFHCLPTGVATHATDGEIEVGYRLKRSAWGNGFATEGTEAIIRRAFDELQVNRIMAVTMAKNTASSRVMQKVGMTFVGQFTEHLFPGSEKKAVIYAIQNDCQA